MSKFIDAAATSHTLSVTAMEEASRLGQRTADIDHMFLALVVNEQIAGQVLRSFGITLDSARRAVAAQHSEQLASIGISAETGDEGRIVFHETDGYEWGQSAVDIIKRAGKGEKRGDAAAVLRELLAEPSGMIEAVLHRLGVEPAEVTRRLDEAEHFSTHAPKHTFEPGALSGVSESFAPAPVEQVWDLLADCARMHEWDPQIGNVESASPTESSTVSPAGRGPDIWVGRSRLERPDGKAMRVKPEYRTQLIELVSSEHHRLIEWRFTYPEAPKANARRVRVELEQAAGGTNLRISLAWERNRGARRPILRLGWVLRPLHRFVIWMQLSQLAGGIGRAFR